VHHAIIPSHRLRSHGGGFASLTFPSFRADRLSTILLSGLTIRVTVVMTPPRSSKKDSATKLAGRMKRRWRVVLLRSKGEILGEVEAPDANAAKAAAAVQFDLDEVQRNRIMVQELR
jgi:hypothetical protein